MYSCDRVAVMIALFLPRGMFSMRYVHAGESCILNEQ